jgi:hypothetical protein
VPANSILTLPRLDLAEVLAREGLVLVKLALVDSNGATRSENLYWQGRDAASQRRLVDLSPQQIDVTAHSRPRDRETGVDVILTNKGREPALAIKITLLDQNSQRVLPIYYDDNYIALLPGETRRIHVVCPDESGQCARVALRGWNAEPREIVIGPPVR